MAKSVLCRLSPIERGQIRGDFLNIFFTAHYVVLVVAVVIILLLILNDIIKRGELADEVVAKSLFRFNHELFGFIIATMALIFIVNDFMTSFNHVYSILVPDYLVHWYELLWLDNLYGLDNLDDDMTTLIAVIIYTRKLEQLLINSPFFLTGFYYLYKGLRRIELCESGVYLVRCKINWDSIKSYEWDETKTISLSYKLSLHRAPETKIEKLFDLSPEIKLIIDSIDKERVDMLLAMNISNTNA